MQDLIYIAATVALFAVSVAFVFVCDRLIGPDEEALAEEGPEQPVDAPIGEQAAA